MSRPRLLDLFCGGGGAGVGYANAGFEVVGVDINPQPHYPFEFIQADVLSLDPAFLAGFSAIHASPPCQAYTAMQALNTRAPKRDHPKLVEPVRAMLIASRRPYVIENVPGAPMIDPIMLCGSMFGLGVRRHRLFECNFYILWPLCEHRGKPRPVAVYGDHPQQPGDKTYRVNRARNLAEGQDAMGIDWMPWRPLTQAIPPAYTQFIGRQLMRAIADTHPEGEDVQQASSSMSGGGGEANSDAAPRMRRAAHGHGPVRNMVRCTAAKN